MPPGGAVVFSRNRSSLFACALALGFAFVVATLPSAPAAHAEVPAVPQESGCGKRIIYDKSRQRVWLVRGDRSIAATYLVSGHLYGTLPAVGKYRVQSKSRYTRSLDGSVTMEYMVRFVYGNTRWIGFHSIPRNRAGNLIQPLSALGTPTSSGCVRQKLRNAERLYRFAPIGAPVVVIR